MPAPDPLLTVWDVIEAAVTEPFKRLIGAFTPEPRQRDYALAGYKTGEQFVADEEAKDSRVMAKELLDEMLAEDAAKDVERCSVCNNEVKVMCLVGTGICSILCEKVAKGEIDQAKADAITEGTTVESGIK